MDNRHPWFWQSLDETMEALEQSMADAEDNPKLAATTMEAAADHLAEQFIDEYHSTLRTEQFHREGFEHRLHAKWYTAIDFLEFFIILNQNLGRARNHYDRKNAAEHNDYVFDAVTRLHARGCQVSKEILTLLKSGYSDGADARWRSLHELATTALFIKSTGQETAERFLLYKTIEDYYEIDAYQKHQEQLGYETLPERDVEAVRNARDALLDRFGKQYDSQYGWAAHEFSEGRTGFKQIEADTEMDHYRHFYKMASNNVHAGAKGTLYHIGTAGGATASQQILPGGPSNYGLDGPGQITAISLTQLTASVLTHNPDPFWLACGFVVNQLVDEVAEAFVAAGASLDAEINHLN